MRTIHAQPLSSPYELHLGQFYAPAPMVVGIKRLCASDVCLSRTSGLSREQREQRPRKTKIGTDVAHVIPDSDTTFKVKRSKVNLQGRGIMWRSRPTQLVLDPESQSHAIMCMFSVSSASILFSVIVLTRPRTLLPHPPQIQRTTLKDIQTDRTNRLYTSSLAPFCGDNSNETPSSF